MDESSIEDLFISNIAEKETYTSDEKKFILERLNNERLRKQEADDKSSNRIKGYSEQDKCDILNRLNEERLRTQKFNEMEKKRLYNKKIYKFGQKKYYKLVDMEREYYLDLESYQTFSSRPSIITLYYRTFGEMKEKDVLLKIEMYTEKIFISYDAIRVYFKGYSFEDAS